MGPRYETGNVEELDGDRTLARQARTVVGFANVCFVESRACTVLEEETKQKTMTESFLRLGLSLNLAVGDRSMDVRLEDSLLLFADRWL